MKKVRRSTCGVRTPEAAARSRFCTTARIRRPAGSLLRYSQIAISATTTRPMMKSRVYGIETPATVMPPSRKEGAFTCTLGAPKMSRASCWSISETPQVTSSVSSGRPCSRLIKVNSRISPSTPPTRKASGSDSPKASVTAPAPKTDVCST